VSDTYKTVYIPSYTYRVFGINLYKRFVEAEKKNRDRSERRYYTISTRRYKRKIEMYTIARETSYYYRGNNLAAAVRIIIIVVYIHNIILLL